MVQRVNLVAESCLGTTFPMSLCAHCLTTYNQANLREPGGEKCWWTMATGEVTCIQTGYTLVTFWQSVLFEIMRSSYIYLSNLMHSPARNLPATKQTFLLLLYLFACRLSFVLFLSCSISLCCLHQQLSRLLLLTTKKLQSAARHKIKVITKTTKLKRFNYWIYKYDQSILIHISMRLFFWVNESYL